MFICGLLSFEMHCHEKGTANSCSVSPFFPIFKRGGRSCPPSAIVLFQSLRIIFGARFLLSDLSNLMLVFSGPTNPKRAESSYSMLLVVPALSYCLRIPPLQYWCVLPYIALHFLISD
jgi:hypothetical protein